MTVHRARPSETPQEAPRPVRVLYLIDALGPGGAEHLLAESLPHLARHGVIPAVAALHSKEGNPVAERIAQLGVEVSELGVERLRQPDGLRRVMTAAQKHNTDLIHTQLEFSNVLGSLAARRLRIPAVATLHTLDAPPPRSRRSLHFRAMSFALRHWCDRVIAVSESARQHHLGAARLTPAKVITLYNGIDTARFDPHPATRPDVRDELGIPRESPLITTVAVLREPKGIQHMLRALPDVLRTHPEVRYLVVGDGPHGPALRTLAADLGVDHAVVWAGSRLDVERMLAATDVFVLPSLTEALPTVIAEAMASGLPVVATDVGGVAEMIDHGTSGFVVESGDPQALVGPIVRLLENPRQGEAMGRAGKRRSRRDFDVARQAERLAEQYRIMLRFEALR